MDPNFCEIARSFTFKLNIGNYQSADFFCSQKVCCPLAEAEATSKKLYDFCRAEVAKAISLFKADRGMN